MKTTTSPTNLEAFATPPNRSLQHAPSGVRWRDALKRRRRQRVTAGLSVAIACAFTVGTGAAHASSTTCSQWQSAAYPSQVQIRTCLTTTLGAGTTYRAASTSLFNSAPSWRFINAINADVQTQQGTIKSWDCGSAGWLQPAQTFTCKGPWIATVPGQLARSRGYAKLVDSNPSPSYYSPLVYSPWT